MKSTSHDKKEGEAGNRIKICELIPRDVQITGCDFRLARYGQCLGSSFVLGEF